MTSTALNVLESVYRFGSPFEDWLREVGLSIAPALHSGFGAGSVSYWSDGASVRIESVVMTVESLGHEVYRSAAGTPSEAFHRAFVRGPAFTSFSEQLAGSGHEGYIQRSLSGIGIEDVVVLNAHTEDGRGLMVGCPQPQLKTTTRKHREHWNRVAAHLEAALRLRTSLGGQRPCPDSAAAVFTPRGELLHATRPLVDDTAVLARLRVAVMRLVELRRVKPASAVDLWKGLVAGHWSIVDAIDSDGGRYLVALENPSLGVRLRALTEQESRVTALAARGRTNKSIAYSLGLSEGTVSSCLHRARRKLGVERRAELIGLARLNQRAFRAELEPIDGHVVLIESGSSVPEGLSRAEREVAFLAGMGCTNREIGRRRGTSERTVANQIASILRKTGVGSRFELSCAEAKDAGSPST